MSILDHSCENEAMKTWSPSMNDIEKDKHKNNTKSDDKVKKSEKMSIVDNEFYHDLKKFVMLTKNLEAQLGDNRKKVESETMNRRPVEKLKENSRNLSDDRVTSTEIIFQNSTISRWSDCALQVLNLYRNDRNIVITSSDTFHSMTNNYNQFEKVQGVLNSQNCDQNEESPKKVVSSSAQITKDKTLNKTRQKKQDQTKCKRNFIQMNKNLTKFTLRGKQKVNTIDRLMCRRKTKRKTKKVIQKYKSEEFEVQNLKEYDYQYIDDIRYNKQRFGEIRQPENIMITDVLYLV